MGKADFPWRGISATSHQGYGRNGVMWSAIRAHREQGGALRELACHTVNLGCLERLAQREWWQD